MIAKITFFLLMILLVSCFSKNEGYWKLNDGDFELQLMDISSKAENKSIHQYRFRILPARQLEGQINTEIKSSMWYKMDSSIYLLNGINKIYPEAVEPVANGVKNSFEYMILFENDKIEKDSLKLVYQDKHLNQKAYIFNLIKE